MRSVTIGKRIIALMMTALMICGAAFCNATIDVFGATFAQKSPFKIYNSDTMKTEKKTYNHNEKFKNDLILNGVDISAWQEELNSSELSANIDFAILRTSYTGLDSNFALGRDKKFAEHYRNAKAAGKLIGAYHYSQATTTEEAEAEAEFTVNQLKAAGAEPGDLNMPVYMDYEFGGGRLTSSIKKKTATACARAFCNKIKELGYVPGLYANLSFLNNTVNGVALGEEVDIWCAQYYNTCEFTGNYSKWQYSSVARINGLYNNGKKTNIDVNFWYVEKNRTSTSSNDIASCDITVAKQVQYTSAAVTPTVTVKSGSKTLVKGRDYAIGYVRNVNLGTGYAYISGIGEYTGYKLVSFAIVEKVDPEDEPVDVELVLTDKGSDAGYKLTDEELTGIVAGTKVSAVKAAVKFKNENNTCTKKIIDKDNDANLGSSKLVTNGDRLAVYDENGSMIKAVKLAVIGTKAKFTSVSGAKKKIKVKWGKLASSKASGYQLQYCLDKSMPSDLVGTKNIKSYKTTSATLSTNYKGTYYVRIRSYKTIRSVKNYSKWSAVKSVKVK